jgi:hypothetical protein
VARQAWQPRRGTWRPNVRDRTCSLAPAGLPWPGMTELLLAPGQRDRCGWVLACRRSGAHTGHDVVLLQTLAAAKTADTGVKLSAEASRAATRDNYSGAPAMNGSQPAPLAPAGGNAPATVDLASIQAAHDTSRRGQERANRQEPINKPRRRRISRSASPLSRGVTTPDLPEGI